MVFNIVFHPTQQYQICEAAIQQYRQHPEERSLAIVLRKIRQEVARAWLAVPDNRMAASYEGELGKLHRLLLESGFRYEALTEEETQFTERLKQQLVGGIADGNGLRSLLAVMPYCRADLLPPVYRGARIPPWFVSDFIKFFLFFPSYFERTGEVAGYARCLQGFIGFTEELVRRYPDSKFWQETAIIFANHANLVPLYFHDENLRPAYQKRSYLMEFALGQAGNVVDFVPDARPPRDKIRLGILKQSFAVHPETFVTLPIFEYLDRDRFEIVLYVVDSDGNLLESYCKSRCDRFVPLPKELPDQVRFLRQENIDLLFCASILTNAIHRSILLALHRLARVQIANFASPATTGMRHIDYFISGRLAEPNPGAQNHYSERLIQLPGTGFCFSHPTEPQEKAHGHDRKRWTRNEEDIVFISGANFFKIIPEVRETWAKILAMFPKSVLVLFPFGPAWGRTYPRVPFRENMRSTCARHGVDRDRLHIFDTLANRKTLVRVLEMGDIYLGAYPYSGCSSIVDALMAGLPPIAWEGNCLRSRSGSAILRDMELPELVATREAEYIDITLKLAGNAPWRQALQQRIREKMQQTPDFLNSRAFGERMSQTFVELFERSLRT